VSQVARQRGINASQLFAWRRQALAKGLVSDNRPEPAVAPALTFAPVNVTEEPAPVESGEEVRPARRRKVPRGSIIIEIELKGGDRVLRGRRSGRAHRLGVEARMIAFPPGVRVWLATGHTDMRKGFPSLALQVQEVLRRDPLSGHLFCFRGRRGDLLKVIWHDGQGACLFTKRLERGRFLWPSPADGVVTISAAQLGYLLSGIDWRHPQETWRPTSVG
jgi:transposase